MRKHKAPTAEQKLAIYKKAREFVVENGRYRCICIAVREAQKDLGFVNKIGESKWRRNIAHDEDNGNNMENNFPELLKFKPKWRPIEIAWWKLTNKKANPRRVKVIDMIIAELEAQL